MDRPSGEKRGWSSARVLAASDVTVPSATVTIARSFVRQ